MADHLVHAGLIPALGGLTHARLGRTLELGGLTLVRPDPTRGLRGPTPVSPDLIPDLRGQGRVWRELRPGLTGRTLARLARPGLRPARVAMLLRLVAAMAPLAYDPEDRRGLPASLGGPDPADGRSEVVLFGGFPDCG